MKCRFYIALDKPENLEFERDWLFNKYKIIIDTMQLSINNLWLDCLWETNKGKWQGLFGALKGDNVIFTHGRYLDGFSLSEVIKIPIDKTSDCKKSRIILLKLS